MYLIRAGEMGLVKIGFSDSVHARLVKIQSDTPQKLTILRILDGGRELEKTLHARFADHRERGEWFRFHPGMMGDLHADDLSLRKASDSNKVFERRTWSPEARLRAADRQLAVHADPERKAARQASMAATALRKLTINNVYAVMSRAGGWRKLSAATGVPAEELMQWKRIPVHHLEAVALAARVPVTRLAALVAA